ncbi:hypothetical protein QF031_001333 [Pseudarthrobacter defluvii]|nr:hypothetical protein [Pseudarthrobacter defluvii]
MAAVVCSGSEVGTEVDVGVGVDVAATEEVGANVAEGAGAGLTSAAVATPAIPGPASIETANRATPIVLTVGLRD